MPWIYLLLAGLFEIGFAMGLKYSDGFTRLWPTVLTICLAAISLWLLTPSRWEPVTRSGPALAQSASPSLASRCSAIARRGRAWRASA